MSLTIILGGPGCGKTKALLDIIDDLLGQGVSPARIAYLTFTRRAAFEGLTRAMEKFSYEEKALPYFRTIHSLAFQQLAIASESVMTATNWQEFGLIVGLDFTAGPMEDPTGYRGSQFLSVLQYAREREIPLRESSLLARVDPEEVDYIEEKLIAFKQDRGLVDFTDMLEMFQTKGIVPPVDYLIVDEGQDLTTLQWKAVNRISSRVHKWWVAGDDDQAIYGWAGADVQQFLDLAGDITVLPVSYRLKRNIFNVTNAITANIKKRFTKDWEPHAEGGLVERVNSISHVNLDKGSWYVLARNHYLLNPLRNHLRLNGYSYIENGQSSTDNAHVRAMIYWEMLRRGEEVTGHQAKDIYNSIKREYVEARQVVFDDDETFSLEALQADYGLGTSAPWFDVMRFSPAEIEYYRACLKRGEKLLGNPRITLSTAHGVKGGEADNVFLVTDVAKRTYDTLHGEKADEEHRVFYVAASRAKDALFICNPMSSRYYEIEVMQ